MHVQRLTEIAEWLEAGAPRKGYATGFNMQYGIKIDQNLANPQLTQNEFGEYPIAQAEAVLSTCGTTCCIAGAAVLFYNEPAEKLAKHYFRLYGTVLWHGHHGIEEEATSLLELTEREARYLFTPHDVWNGRLEDYNDPAWAARVIRGFIATGTVDWIAYKEPKAAA